MLFSKSLFVHLVAIFCISWLFEGGPIGVAYACPSSADTEEPENPSTPEVWCPSKLDAIYMVPKQGANYAPLTVGMWIGETYYRLPNAPYYQVIINKGNSRSIRQISNAYYRGGPVFITSNQG